MWVRTAVCICVYVWLPLVVAPRRVWLSFKSLCFLVRPLNLLQFGDEDAIQELLEPATGRVSQQN